MPYSLEIGLLTEPGARGQQTLVIPVHYPAENRDINIEGRDSGPEACRPSALTHYAIFLHHPRSLHFLGNNRVFHRLSVIRIYMSVTDVKSHFVLCTSCYSDLESAFLGVV